MFTPSIVVLMMMNTVAASGAAVVALFGLCGLPALEAAKSRTRPAAPVSEDDGMNRRGSGRHENDFERPS